MKKTIASAWMIALVLVCGGIALADDATNGKITDPAFDMYVNPETLELARSNADASLMLDVAMQLAEGEKVLLRSHRGVSADDMLKLAAKVATAKGDEATQARFKKAVEKLGKSNLTAEFDTIAKLAGESRNAAKPKFSTGDDKNAATLVDDVVGAIDDAVLLQNTAELQKIGQSLERLPLSEKVRAEITEYINKADPALVKLAGESRQFGGGGGGGGGGIILKKVEYDPNAGGGPYWSKKLRADFVVVPSGGRCITGLHWSSPLRKAGLEVGDIIIRLDGIPVNSDWELENHYSWTTVDLIDVRTGNNVRRKIYIP